MGPTIKNTKLYSTAKIAVINLVVFLLLLVLIELALIGFYQARCIILDQCVDPYPNPLSAQMRKEVEKFNSVHPFHPELGYLPKAGVSVELEPGKFRPKHTNITINADGFRDNVNGFENRQRDVIALGDSFTFGIEVSDHQSWPACLESSLNRRVDNAGVPGYGTAQALKRGQLEFDKADYQTVILSTLVGADFERDRMQYFYGLPSTVLIEKDGNLEWAPVPGKMDTVGTRYRPYKPNMFEHFLYYQTILGSRIWQRTGMMQPRAPMHLMRHHPDAADKKSIIEKTIKDFAKIKAPHKLLLLQYVNILSVTDADMIKTGLEERKLILEIAKTVDIDVIDTFDSFADYDPEDIWAAHHTPLGNRVVCKELVTWFDSVK